MQVQPIMNTFNFFSSACSTNLPWHDLDWGASADVRPGSHLVTSRNGYVHHGIYLGEQTVIHYAGMCGDSESGPIEVIHLTRFANGRQVRVRRHMQASFKPERVVERALTRIGEDSYRLLTNNCEHFCYWCLFGRNESPQVREVLYNPLKAIMLVTLCRKMVISICSSVIRKFLRLQPGM